VRSPNIRYRQGLDQLRGIAALLIVFYHGLHVLSFFPRAQGGDPYRFWIQTWNPGMALIEEGHSAVGFFIVLSGFLFSVSALGKEVVYGGFLRNRVLRIFPLFVLVLVVGSVANPASYSFLGVMQTLLMQADFPGAAQGGAFSGMFWAVAVEFQLYLIFPFLHRFTERYGLRWALACIALCVAMRFLAASVGSSNARDIAYSHVLGRLDQFIIGMLAARLFRRIEARRLPWGILSLAATGLVLAVLTCFNQLGGYPTTSLWKVVWPILEALTWAPLLLAYTCFAERLPSWLGSPLAAFGTISYSVYLLHNACIVTLPRLWYPQLSSDPNSQALLFVLCVVLPVLVALAALSYYVVERPFLALRVSYLRQAPSESHSI
jgi:peptidoglycan/LPS O-acetylase OafA/YrhL